MIIRIELNNDAKQPWLLLWEVVEAFLKLLKNGNKKLEIMIRALFSSEFSI